MKGNGELENRDKLLFAVIFAGLLLRLLFFPPIWHHGEAREGLVVQGIVHHQQWILPFRNGRLPSKPPFFHWLAASAAMIFGESDFTMRLPSAIGAGVMVVVTFLLGRAMAGRLTGWLAVGALLGIYEFWVAAAQARVDMIFSACVTTAIAGFYFWYRDGTGTARAVCYLATVCAVLAKGPVGIALVGFPIVGFLAVEKGCDFCRDYGPGLWLALRSSSSVVGMDSRIPSAVKSFSLCRFFMKTSTDSSAVTRFPGAKCISMWRSG